MRKKYKIELPSTVKPNSYAEEYLGQHTHLDSAEKHKLLLVFAQYSPACVSTPYMYAFQAFCYQNPADRYSWGQWG